MELSAFSVVDAYPEAVGLGRDRYVELLALAETADRAGLSCFWVAEHHFHPGGLCPSPPVVLAAAGARTRRIRLGCLVCVLPFHAPVEVAETYGLLDELIGGRLNFGVGSGYIPLEFDGFGVDATQKREAFDAALPIILDGMAGEPVPAPHAPGGTVRLNVRSRQRPHPPLWIAAQRREALPFIARRGASLALVPYATVSGIPELADEIREFRRAAPPTAHPKVSVALHLYAGDRPAEARQALQRYLDSRLASQSTFYQDKVRRDPRHASAEVIEQSGFALFGTAEEVIDRLRAFESAGVDEVLGIFDFGGLSAEAVTGSVERLGAGWPR
jgi:alkanesulfonate monooxygenase SsuD/methylene tetrahydromethanopterin reductase-like flavin-dependent oxidoreductase (luciferase family)